MWKLYLTAKTTGSRPSDLLSIEDRWAAYQLDSAVTTLGLILENASQEMEEVGEGKNKRLLHKYEMAQLLDPDFKLPRPPTPEERDEAAVRGLAAWAMKSDNAAYVKVDD